MSMNLLYLWAGILLGWITHPIVWLALGSPFRALHYLTVASKQESGWNPNAAGDNGDSVGMLQFNYRTWPALTGRPLDDRKNPFLSGYYAIVYIQDALLSDWHWWYQVRMPWYGMASLRWMWTHGVGKAPAFSDALEAANKEGQTWKTYWSWLAVFLVPCLLILGFVGSLSWSKVKKGKNKGDMILVVE